MNKITKLVFSIVKIVLLILPSILTLLQSCSWRGSYWRDVFAINGMFVCFISLIVLTILNMTTHTKASNIFLVISTVLSGIAFIIALDFNLISNNFLLYSDGSWGASFLDIVFVGSEVLAPFLVAILSVIEIICSKEARTVSQGVSDKINQTDTVNKLVEYKELLDMGAITEEEFNAKKKQLLGL